MSVTGKTIIITGASRGMGEATARYFGEKGANVVLAARGEDKVKQIATEIGPNARAIACDVSIQSQVHAVVDLAIAEFGHLDILINNAGTLSPIGMFADIDPEAWGHVIDVNVKGVFYGMHAAIPKMIAKGGGTIINISSGAAYHALEGWAHYCASKAAVLQLTRAGHAEYGDKGIRCIGLVPGTVATEMQREIKTSGINAVSEMDFSDHIDPRDTAIAMEYLIGSGGDTYLGGDFALRTNENRAEVGLPPR